MALNLASFDQGPVTSCADGEGRGVGNWQVGRRMGFSTIVIGFLTSVILTLTIMPGNDGEQYCESVYLHGWPLVFLKRAATNGATEGCWRITQRVLWFSPWRLILDSLCAAALLAVAVGLYEKWRRRTTRFTISLGAALFTLGATSVCMLLSARWVANRVEVNRIAIEHHWHLMAAGPNWFREPITSLGYDPPANYLPLALLRPDPATSFLRFPAEFFGLEFKTNDFSGPSIESAITESAQIQRCLDLAPDVVNVNLTLLGSGDEGALYAERLRACRRLFLTTQPDAAPQWGRWFAELSELRILFIETDATEMVPLHSGDVVKILELIPHKERLTALDICVGRFADPGLNVLRRFQNLESFTVRCDPDSPTEHVILKNAMRLFQLSNLTVVNDRNEHFRIRGIEYLSQYPKLESLQVWDCLIDAPDVDSLAAIRRLKLLQLSGTELTNDALARLSSLNRLRYLYVSDCTIAGARLTSSQLDGLRLRMPNTWVE